MARQVPLSGKRFSRLGEAELVADEVHQVGGILAVVDGEVRLEPDLRGVFAQEPRADGVEGAGPAQGFRHRPRLCAEHGGADTLDAAAHLGRGPARKRQQHHAARVGAVRDQMRDAVRQRVGLAGAGAGDDQKRRKAVVAAVLDSATLVGIEVGGERYGGHQADLGSGESGKPEHSPL